MGRTFVETIMGAVVLLVAAFFLLFAYRQADLGTVKGYTLTAKFASVGGLATGGDVRINGIKVGTVVSQRIDPETFLAVVTLSVSPAIRLPDDTVATIDDQGLLTDMFLKLIPGKSKTLLADGGAIAHTQTTPTLEEQVSKFIFVASGSDASKGAK